MILTQLTLTERASRESRDARFIHKAVSAAFDQQHPLWCQPRRGLVIVQSKQPLDNIPAWATGMVHRPLNLIGDGAKVTVALIGCPTKAQRIDSDHRGIRTPLPAERWDEWARRKLADAITIDAIRHEPLPKAVGWKRDRKVTINRIAFTITGRVINADLFHHMRESGVGTGKAYGAGLMLAVERTEE